MVLVREGLNRLGEEDLARQVSSSAPPLHPPVGWRPVAGLCTGPPQASVGRPSGSDRSGARGWRCPLPGCSGKRILRQLDRNRLVGARERSISLQPLDAGLYNGLSGCSLFSGLFGCGHRRQVLRTHRQKGAHPDSKVSRSRASRRAAVTELGGIFGIGRNDLHADALGGPLAGFLANRRGESGGGGRAGLIETDRMLDVLGGSRRCDRRARGSQLDQSEQPPAEHRCPLRRTAIAAAAATRQRWWLED